MDVFICKTLPNICLDCLCTDFSYNQYIASVSFTFAFMTQGQTSHKMWEIYTFWDAFFLSATDLTLLFNLTKQQNRVFSLLSGPYAISRPR